MLSGVHTHSDIPNAVTIAQTLCPQPLELLPPFGHWQGTKALLRDALASHP
ncbi:MAG: sirohydrochlorin chelatase, partial [Oscillatoriales cyanobacterium SM2_2_1]|nr:sirohydrochlorin chelatase [Oscillatoriales cyanobacterium SM2_2_1]